MNDLILYIHGQGGSADESRHYGPLFPGSEVIGLNYQTFTPWETGREIHDAVRKRKQKELRLMLIANSIGAFFSMNAGIDEMVERAYSISPIVDMERFILDRMEQADVTEAQLRAEGVIATASGVELSWEYLCWVRAHPIQWTVPTEILYGSCDNLTSRKTMEAFARKHGAKLTVMENGEHWFHTQEQLRFLDAWIKSCEPNEDEMLRVLRS